MPLSPTFFLKLRLSVGEMCSIPTANERLTLFICLFSLVFRDKVSLCSPGCPRTHFVDQAGLELRDLPTSQVLGSKARTSTPISNTLSTHSLL